MLPITPYPYIKFPSPPLAGGKWHKVPEGVLTHPDSILSNHPSLEGILYTPRFTFCESPLSRGDTKKSPLQVAL